MAEPEANEPPGSLTALGLSSSFRRTLTGSWRGRRGAAGEGEDEDESRQQRMTSWSVFGAVMDDDAFEKAMADGSKKLRKSSSAATFRRDRTTSPEPAERPWASARASVSSFQPFHLQDDRADGILADGRLTSEPNWYTSLPHRPPDDPESSSDDETDTSDDEGELQDGRPRRAASTAPSPNPPYHPEESRISRVLADWSSKSPRFAAIWQRARRGLDLKAHHRTIIKCSIAYLIASLFTFVTPLSRLLSESFDIDGPFSSAHTLATIVTYYRPAPTPGAMMQANAYALFGLLYTAVLVLGSMGTAVGLNNLGYEWLSHAIIVVFWIGFGYALIAYAKQKRANPTFSTTCSMICVISSVIITREGSVHYGYFETSKLEIYTAIALLGVVISNLVCLTLWRGSATGKLRSDINRTLDSFSTLFTVLVKTFLLDDSISLKGDKLKRAIDGHNASFTSLKKSLDEALFEFREPRIRAAEPDYKELVASMTRLAQHLTGLRSGCGLQADLIRAARGQASGKDEDGGLGPARKVFEVFRERVGPSLKTLMVCGSKTLQVLRHSLRGSRRQTSRSWISDPEFGADIEDLTALRPMLIRALEQFELRHSDEMKRLYRDAPSQVEILPAGLDSFTGAVDASRPNEEVFLIYFFLFSLEEFVRELSHLVEVLASIKHAEETSTVRWWLLRACCGRRSQKSASKTKSTFGQKLGRIFPVDPRADRDSPFPLPRQSQGDQNRRPEASRWQTLKSKLHDAATALDQPDVRFAAKVGLGAACLALAAFARRSRPIYEAFKGQWAIVSYMVVMSSTVGQTNLLVLFRLLGTLLGAAVAVLAYHLFWEDPVVLPIVGFLFSLPCFWIMVVKPAYASTGRFILLSYNLTCLYAYNVREDEVQVVHIAYHRVVSVFVGVLWGWIVTNVVWPYKARRELRVELSGFLLGCAFLYSHLVRQYSTPPSQLDHCNPDDVDHTSHSAMASPSLSMNGRSESAPLISKAAAHHLDDSARDFLNMELFLQVKLLNLHALLAATKHEPRLKGPFPVPAYRDLLFSSQTILDMFHSMRSITHRPRWYHTLRRDFIVPVQKERQEMVGNVLLYFSCLATSVELKAPLPPWLPPAGRARERLLEKVRELPVVKRRLVKGRSDYLLYFAYLVAMKTVVQHLDIMGKRAQELYGVIGGVQSAQDFEAMFESPENFELDAGDVSVESVQ